jgi:hypothetical protein
MFVGPSVYDLVFVPKMLQVFFKTHGFTTVTSHEVLLHAFAECLYLEASGDGRL